MRFSLIAVVAAVAAAAPSMALPFDRMDILSRALQYSSRDRYGLTFFDNDKTTIPSEVMRREPVNWAQLSEIDKIPVTYGRRSDFDNFWQKFPHGTIGIVTNPPVQRSPEPFVVLNGQEQTYIPACHRPGVLCDRSLLDELVY